MTKTSNLITFQNNCNEQLLIRFFTVVSKFFINFELLIIYIKKCYKKFAKQFYNE